MKATIIKNMAIVKGVKTQFNANYVKNQTQKEFIKMFTGVVIFLNPKNKPTLVDIYKAIKEAK